MLTFALAALLTVPSAEPIPFSPARPDRSLVPSMTVVGQGEALAKPDTASVQVGIVTQAASASKALKDNNAAMQGLFKALAARGIVEKDIQTSNFSVTPGYHRDPDSGAPPEVIGYQVSNQVRVKIRDLAALGEVLDEVVATGANRVQGVSFSVASPNDLLDDARRKAMADARRKADLYAKAAGVKVGRVLLVQEQSPQVPRPQMSSLARDAAASVPVAPGELEFQARITVTYAIE